MATKNSYGWIFDKQGNRKKVHAPFTAVTEELVREVGFGVLISAGTRTTFKRVKKHTETVSGKIPDSVGYPGFPSDNIPNISDEEFIKEYEQTDDDKLMDRCAGR